MLCQATQVTLLWVHLLWTPFLSNGPAVCKVSQLFTVNISKGQLLSSVFIRSVFRLLRSYRQGEDRINSLIISVYIKRRVLQFLLSNYSLSTVCDLCHIVYLQYNYTFLAFCNSAAILWTNNFTPPNSSINIC